MSESHEDLIARYVLGEMDLDEQVAFEARLAGDPELARQTEQALTIDGRLQLAGLRELATPRTSENTPRASENTPGTSDNARAPVLRFRLLAAAALVAFAIGGFLWSGGHDVETVRVALVRSAPSYEQFLSLLEIPADEAPRESTRAATSTLPAAPEATPIVDGLLARERGDVDRALREAADELEGEAFTVPIETDHPVWVAVFGVLPDGELKLYHPGSAYDDIRHSILPSGRHVLPAARVSASAEERSGGAVRFEPGFVLPRRHDRMTACIVVRETAPTEAAWQKVRELLAAPSADNLTKVQDALPDGTWFRFAVRAR